jgi:2-oxoisovalerate dehydrogenase E1 component alpha subunit
MPGLMNKFTHIDIEQTADRLTAISPEDLIEGYRKMVVGRRLDQQATNLAKQGYLTVYPSSRGQEACQIAAAMALASNDWLFPTYRDTVAMISHGVDPVEALTMLRGNWHCGFNPNAVRTAPHAAPLATHAAHAAGLAMAARYCGDDVVSLVLCGEGSTSEGDFHEAVNLAAVFDLPVVFLVQHNGYAISVPSSRQFRARSIAERAPGYGIKGVEVDGNDFAETLLAVRGAVDHARAGLGPVLIEARTYRMAAHTNSDDPSLYRDPAEALEWQKKDPLMQLKSRLEAMGLLDEITAGGIHEEAQRKAADLRQAIMQPARVCPSSLFAHVYAVLPPHLEAQRMRLSQQELLS